jgi:hypothetical protein
VPSLANILARFVWTVPDIGELPPHLAITHELSCLLAMDAYLARVVRQDQAEPTDFFSRNHSRVTAVGCAPAHRAFLVFPTSRRTASMANLPYVRDLSTLGWPQEMHGMDNKIASLNGLEILDSRGHPTIRIAVVLESGIRGMAGVPSGASTGENEAVELRDGDPNRFGGKGVPQSIEHVETEIAHAVVGRDALSQLEIERVLVDLDETPNKSRLSEFSPRATARSGVLEAPRSAFSITWRSRQL